MIQINLLRVSPDSKYLEFSIECPTNYRFNKLFIKKYDYLTTTGYPENNSGWIDGSALYKQESTKEIMRIDSSIFGGSTIFYVEFGITWVGVNPEPLLRDGTKLSDKTSIGVCSDVNQIYNYLLQCILNLEKTCSTLNNETRRAFIMLYGHTEAMRLERFEEAEYFYEVLRSNFSNCSTDLRLNTNNCNCS